MFYMHMGVALTDKGYIPDLKKQDRIVTIPLPTNNDELTRLLGVVPNLSRFSEQFLNQVRTTENSAEEQQCVYLGIK